MRRVNLWETRSLVKNLAEDRLSQRDKFEYLLIGQAMYAAFSAVPVMLFPGSFDGWFVGEMLTLLAITIWGVHRCYRNNGGSSGERFLEYFVCLSVPVFVKAVLLIWAGYALFFWATDRFVSDLPLAYDPYLYVFVQITTWGVIAGSSILFYWRISRHIGAIQTSRPSKLAEDMSA